MPDVLIQPATPPNDAAMPDTPARLANFVASYLRITGLESLQGIVIDTAEPAPEDRNKVWCKVDAATNRPIGLYAFRGEWLRLPVIPGYGPSDERPGNPQPGEQYFDSDISALIVYERGKWRTAFGSPGDVKFVSATTLEDALEKNPGWSDYSAARGRVLVGAGAGLGLTERTHGETWGSEQVTLTVEQIPAHTHRVPGMAEIRDDVDVDVSGKDAGVQNNTVANDTESTGGGQPHENCQPSLALWCLIKD